MEMGGQLDAPAALPPQERDTVPILQETGWTPGLVWTGEENIPPTGISSADLQMVASQYTNYTILGQRKWSGTLYLHETVTAKLQENILFGLFKNFCENLYYCFCQQKQHYLTESGIYL
jgi:hypothetical protein